ncbi:MAG: insulinase family protein [Thermoplasmata archaeon]|nr:insulinase family protein [Thermoplasmata archaeon]MCI4361933.1 insulinase family protein [Thermoplasmata archaeon]
MTADRNDPLLFSRLVRADGLTIVRQPSPPGSAGFAATYVAPAGWAYDPEGREGLAVVTSLVGPSAAGRRDRVALARELDRLGGSLERHCAPESAEVGVSGPASELEPLLGLLADVVLRPRFEPDDLERVRRQMFERHLREATQPGHRAERELLRAVFPKGSPYRVSGLGDHRSVARLRREDVRRFHRATSTSDGGFLVLTTSRSLENVQRSASRLFPEFPSEHPVGFPRVAAASAPRAAERLVPMADRTQTEIRIGGGAPPRSDPRFPALFLANEVLGGRSMLNRLFQHVREQRGLAYHASSDLEAMRWGGYWLAQAGTGPERAQAVVALVAEEVRRIGTRLIPQTELDRIRESTIGEIPLALETAGDAHELAVDGAYHGLSEQYWREWPALLRSVSSRAIREAAGPVYDPAHATTVVAGPGTPVAPVPRRAV